MSGKEKKNFLDERVCPVCKKIFIAAPLHAWKAHGGKSKKLVCSYACDLASFRENEAKKMRNKGVKKND